MTAIGVRFSRTTALEQEIQSHTRGAIARESRRTLADRYSLGHLNDSRPRWVSLLREIEDWRHGKIQERLPRGLCAHDYAK